MMRDDGLKIDPRFLNLQKKVYLPASMAMEAEQMAECPEAR